MNHQNRYRWYAPRTWSMAIGLGVPVVGFALIAPCPARAQDIQTVISQLSSPDLRLRAKGVEGFLTLPPSERTGPAGDLIISLLNSEGEGVMEPQSQQDPSGEAHGGYQMALVRAGLVLHDQRALPGMVYLGLQVDADAETFVLAAGNSAVPILARAWTRGGPLRVPVLSTAAALLTSSQQLDLADQSTLWRILTTANGFEWSLVPELSNYPEFLATVAWTADSGEVDFERGQARSVIRDLKAEISSLSSSDLWKREVSLLAGVCSGTNTAHCESLANVGATVQRNLDARRWLPARNTLSTFTNQLRQSCDGGEFGEGECRVLVGNANQVLAKIPS